MGERVPVVSANHINRHGRCHRWTNTTPVGIVLAKYCLSPTARHAPAGCSKYLRMIQSQYPSEKSWRRLSYLTTVVIKREGGGLELLSYDSHQGQAVMHVHIAKLPK